MIQFRMGVRLHSQRMITTDQLPMSFEEANNVADKIIEQLSSKNSVFNLTVNGGAVLVPCRNVETVEFYINEVET